MGDDRTGDDVQHRATQKASVHARDETQSGPADNMLRGTISAILDETAAVKADFCQVCLELIDMANAERCGLARRKSRSSSNANGSSFSMRGRWERTFTTCIRDHTIYRKEPVWNGLLLYVRSRWLQVSESPCSPMVQAPGCWRESCWRLRASFIRCTIQPVTRCACMSTGPLT